MKIKFFVFFNIDLNFDWYYKAFRFNMFPLMSFDFLINYFVKIKCKVTLKKKEIIHVWFILLNDLSKKQARKKMEISSSFQILTVNQCLLFKQNFASCIFKLNQKSLQLIFCCLLKLSNKTVTFKSILCEKIILNFRF